ncbi:hypothetical protein [Aestuariimicrobium sp. T2.26MG-19.2B]|uniref:hypothetical protein n=1 Tax=Aestuariimicrobium sp. T2.26MG-19.2B TaxID=3040679 RepID=UPI0024774AF7|nr:hypothetical protein [Aestuariimicrobium sp. T2.26MG-19.2B]CAI9400884.1 hypothetical protein AESSP_00481 [Aestuariimicrobium sp. T2.26MG-19.2B]
MGTGIIFALVVIAGLAYLIPWYASRRSGSTIEDEDESFADSMTLIRRAGALVDPAAGECEVSTPMTRRAGLYEVQQAHRAAAVRRRRVMLTLLALTVVTAALPFALRGAPGWVPSVPVWGAAIPGGLLGLFVAVARYSVVSLNERLDRRVEQIQAGWENDTISFAVPAELREAAEAELSVELSVPITGTGSLWDPIPVTTPTYVSKPLVPRTVRTIDLSAPAPLSPRVPVTNDTQEVPVVDESDEVGSRRRAVGE